MSKTDKLQKLCALKSGLEKRSLLRARRDVKTVYSADNEKSAEIFYLMSRALEARLDEIEEWEDKNVNNFSRLKELLVKTSKAFYEVAEEFEKAAEAVESEKEAFRGG